MNQTVTSFYAKDSYTESYDSQHGPRLDAVVDHWKLRDHLKGKRVVDIGGGLGFLGKRLGPEVEYWVIDGFSSTAESRVTTGEWVLSDLDHDEFSRGWSESSKTIPRGQFDAAFALEVLEHLGNVYHALVETKRLVKEGGDVFISIPPISVTHNVPYAGLMWPRQNWEQFLNQMALPIVEYWPYIPKGRGWPAECYHCTNAPWSQKKLLFPKIEEKFRDCTPLEATNL